MDAAMAIATQYEPLNARPAAEINTISTRHHNRTIQAPGKKHLNSNHPRERKSITCFN